MPLPKHPLTLRGGCNCRAIRYCISVPSYAERPLAPYRGSHTGGAADFEVGGDDTRVQAGKDKDLDDEARHWSPIELVLTYHEAISGTAPTTTETLGHYVSSPGRNGWFCIHCGTPLGYSVSEGSLPQDWNWPKMIDIWLGTLDREDLRNEWMRPDHALWCHFAVPWIAEISRAGVRRLVVDNETGLETEKCNDRYHGTTGVKTALVPRHPLFMIDQMEEINGLGGDLEALR